ncbi:MAG: quinone oxidoreductase [Actinomycetota bacterium]|nr:quinone oxidoreductase [Actinomycetota bacterium]
MPAPHMSALVVTGHGGPEVLEVRTVDVPNPGPLQILVEVIASGVNFIDVYRRQGIYPAATPFVLGSECAGRVAAVGTEVHEFTAGDMVTSASANGSHATYALIDSADAVLIPAAVEPEVAAAAMLQAMTAHYLVNSTFQVKGGDEVLVHAGAGGTGQLLVQMCKLKGAHVVSTVGSAAKQEIALGAGADAVIRYDQAPDLAGAVRAASGGGVHVVYDGVGKATFDASLDCLRPRGLLALFGAASGQVPPFDPQRLNRAGSVFVTRPTLVNYLADRQELLMRSGQVLAAIAAGELKVAIGGRYPLDQAARAYADLESRRTTGKLLLVP